MTERDMFTIPAEELAQHSNVPFRLAPDVPTMYRECADEIIADIRAGTEEGRPTRLILPVGPIGQYPFLVERINSERISCRHVWIFQMDEYLDWQGRAIPEDHANSFRAHMRRAFLSPLDPELAPPEEQWFCPLPGNVDEIDAQIEQLGGIDACYGGIGIHGHVAFNEAPLSRWGEISAEEFKRSKTRVLTLAPETIVINAMQVAGGNLEAVPPMAATLGMGPILGARKLRLYCNRGEWQKAVLRRTLMMQPTVRYPATFCQEHPNALVTADLETAQPPPEGPI